MKKILNSASSMVSLIFGLIGIIFLVVSIIIGLTDAKFKENADEVTAVISRIEGYRDIDGDRNYDVFVDYSYGGRNFQDMPLNMYTSSMYEGKEIEILVDRNNPEKISAGSNVITIVFFCIGVGMMVAALIPLFIAANSNKKRDYLKQNGYTIEATVSEINMNYNLTVNGRHPYVIYCIYEDIYSGVQHRFKSGNIWNNPEPIIQQGTVLKVYVNSHSDFSKYYVDVENALEGRIVDYT